MTKRAAAPRVPTPHPQPTTVPAGALVGAAVGLAAGFAVWALAVKLEGSPYHFGYPGNPGLVMDQLVVDQAVRTVARRWIIAETAGMAIGAIAGATAPRLAGKLASWAVAATGLYLLALRGWWGYAGLPALPDGTYPPGIVVEPLPAASIILPATLSLIGAAALFFFTRRHDRGTLKTTDAASLALTHLALSFAAAHLLLQLPLWGSAVEEFIHALPDFTALIWG